jgi:hypothetical protein
MSDCLFSLALEMSEAHRASQVAAASLPRSARRQFPSSVAHGDRQPFALRGCWLSELHAGVISRAPNQTYLL